MDARLLGRVDHLVFSVPALESGIDSLASRLGVRAVSGGQHPGRGSRNALLALGPDSYLEVVAPDPDQPRPPIPRWFRLDDVREAALVTWAAKEVALDSARRAASEAGGALGEIVQGSRTRADGTRLAWRFTDPRVVVADGVVPFLIDWGTSAHPARDAPRGVDLLALRAEHPEPSRVRQILRALGLSLAVDEAERPALIATLRGPLGEVELR